MWNIRSSDSGLTQTDLPDTVKSPTSQMNDLSDVYAETPRSPRLTHDSTIGSSTVIQGEIIASEPLYICGRVEGSISAPGHRVTVGTEGTVMANIDAREIVVMGKVSGNLLEAQRVEIGKDGSVIGDISTVRISVEDGAFVLGAIDIRAAAIPIEAVKEGASDSELEAERADNSTPNLEVAQVA